jgi:hypothetical protein
MSDSGELRAHATYVVRVSRDDAGGIRGVVVRVATGERLPFVDISHAGALLRELIEADVSLPCPRIVDGLT